MREADGAGADFSWSWFGLGGFGGFAGFAGAALIAAFYFWGWDVTANLNEETEGGGRKAGVCRRDGVAAGGLRPAAGLVQLSWPG